MHQIPSHNKWANLETYSGTSNIFLITKFESSASYLPSLIFSLTVPQPITVKLPLSLRGNNTFVLHQLLQSFPKKHVLHFLHS